MADDVRQPDGPQDAFGILRRHVAPGLALASKIAGGNAVESSALGATVVDSNGRELVDFGSYAVPLVGHRHPAVVAAVLEQLERMPTSTRALANPCVTSFIAALVERCIPLDHVWLGCDGADAVEAAVKLARRRTGRSRVLAVERGFHGKTLGALALTSHRGFRRGLEEILGHVTHLSPDDPHAADREVRAGDVAALVLEPIQGEAGVVPLDPHLLRAWSATVHAARGYVVSDEIQVGLRRCGEHSLALAAGLEPDAVLFGKALGGGVMPLSAVVASADLFAPLASDPTWHTATFSFHPLSCAAGLAALNAIDASAENGARIAAVFEGALRALATRHADVISEVRGRGLLWGVEFCSAAMAGAVLMELFAGGLLVSPCLGAPATIRFALPMVTSADELCRACQILERAVAEAATGNLRKVPG